MDVPGWIKVEAALPPRQKVLAGVEDEKRKYRPVIMAEWVPALTVEGDELYTDGLEYDADADTFYVPEGWYECMEYSDEFSSILIEGTVTHWMPIPPRPEVSDA
jgi:hypothetical protein